MSILARAGSRQVWKFVAVALFAAAGCGGKASPAGQQGVADGGVLPAQVGGATLDVKTFAGTQIADPASTQWADLLARLGASASDLSLAISIPPDKAASDFQIGAFRILKTDWATRLSAFVHSANAAGNATFTQVQLGGKTVYRGESVATAAGPRGYYYASGDTLFFLKASDEAEAAEALSKLPAPASAARPPPAPEERLSPDDLPPPTGVLIISPLILPTVPLCVGAPPDPRTAFLFLLADGNGIPPVMGSTSITAALGVASPPVALGPMPSFLIQQTTWGGPGTESVLLNAFSGAYGDHATLNVIPPQIVVAQCLSGALWTDGDRTFQIDQKGALVTAHQRSGTQTCGVPESFSGALTVGAVSQISGADLTVCNPADCVSAGLLPKSSVTTYSGVLSADAKQIDFTWDNTLYTLVYDSTGALVACNPTAKPQGTFSLKRPISDPWPF